LQNVAINKKGEDRRETEWGQRKSTGTGRSFIMLLLWLILVLRVTTYLLAQEYNLFMSTLFTSSAIIKII